MNTPTHDITVNYLGLELCSPLIPSASPMGEHVSALEEMENCGAGAVVLPSLFEDPYERNPRHPDYYFERISKAKEVLKIPVIASLSAQTPEAWKSLSRQIADAGADALELNIYHLSLSPDLPSARVEQGYIDVVEMVAANIKIPVAVKLPPFFTNLAYLGKRLNRAGAKGLVLFNRFYQPDVDLLSMGPGYTLRLSNSSENRLPLRWISLLYQQEIGYLAASTGIRTGGDFLKMILSGASATEVCSILLQKGIPWLKQIESELHQWMDTCKISSLREARGSLSYRCMGNPAMIEPVPAFTGAWGWVSGLSGSGWSESQGPGGTFFSSTNCHETIRDLSSIFKNLAVDGERSMPAPCSNFGGLSPKTYSASSSDPGPKSSHWA
jgi:dihydroorotate dehydrogenase (fumarate)